MTDCADFIREAIEYIDSKPAPFSDQDLAVAGDRVAQAISIGRWQGNKAARFNERGDKALVECEFIAGRHLLICTATFHKVDGVWRLRGVRDTMQALLARKPETNAEPDKTK